MSYQHDREDFIAVVIAEGGTIQAARAILRNANTVQRAAVAECNGPDFGPGRGRPAGFDETAWFARIEKISVAAERRITLAAASFGATAKFSGDPRGCCVKLLLKSGRYNTWGGREDGYGVPTRDA